MDGRSTGHDRGSLSKLDRRRRIFPRGLAPTKINLRVRVPNNSDGPLQNVRGLRMAPGVSSDRLGSHHLRTRYPFPSSGAILPTELHTPSTSIQQPMNALSRGSMQNDNHRRTNKSGPINANRNRPLGQQDNRGTSRTTRIVGAADRISVLCERIFTSNPRRVSDPQQVDLGRIISFIHLFSPDPRSHQETCIPRTRLLCHN